MGTGRRHIHPRVARRRHAPRPVAGRRLLRGFLPPLLCQLHNGGPPGERWLVGGHLPGRGDRRPQCGLDLCCVRVQHRVEGGRRERPVRRHQRGLPRRGPTPLSPGRRRHHHPSQGAPAVPRHRHHCDGGEPDWGHLQPPAAEQQVGLRVQCRGVADFIADAGGGHMGPACRPEAPDRHRLQRQHRENRRVHVPGPGRPEQSFHSLRRRPRPCRKGRSVAGHRHPARGRSRGWSSRCAGPRPSTRRAFVP